MNIVTILNFSSRKHGNCASIDEFIKNYYENTNICVYNINEYIRPCEDCSYECLKEDTECPDITGIKAIMDRIIISDMVYYVVPNFCGFLCANYFVFNERTVGYFHLNRALMNRYMMITKKFIIVSNTEDSVFYKAMEQQSNYPQILYLKSRKYAKKSIAGDILDSEDAKVDLSVFLTIDTIHLDPL